MRNLGFGNFSSSNASSAYTNTFIKAFLENVKGRAVRKYMGSWGI
jgi:hypothetical protein